MQTSVILRYIITKRIVDSPPFVGGPAASELEVSKKDHNWALLSCVNFVMTLAYLHLLNLIYDVRFCFVLV